MKGWSAGAAQRGQVSTESERCQTDDVRELVFAGAWKYDTEATAEEICYCVNDDMHIQCPFRMSVLRAAMLRGEDQAMVIEAPRRAAEMVPMRANVFPPSARPRGAAPVVLLEDVLARPVAPAVTIPLGS